MEQPVSPTMVPIGPGGVLGSIFRKIVMVFTAGMAYPNAWIEGMDCTAIQKESMGALYDKKN